MAPRYRGFSDFPSRPPCGGSRNPARRTTAFQTFARAVLGVPAPKPGDVAALRENVQAWFNRYDTLITKGLPEAPWGIGRLELSGMIFNRLTGLDLGKPPS